MSLDWNLEKIQGYENLCWLDTDDDKVRLNPVTEILTFSTMWVGFSEITEQNWAEFYARFKLIENLDGPLLIKGDGSDWLIEPADIENHIGLSTNAGQEKSRQQWFKDHVASKLDDLTALAKNATANS